MSTAPNSYPSLCSSPPLSKPSTKQALPSFLTFKPSFLTKNAKSLDFSIRVGNSGSGKRSVFIVRAESGETEGEEKYEEYEEYEVEIEQPYGLKFAKGRDGATYIDAIAPGGSADKTKMFSVGDKVLATRESGRYRSGKYEEALDKFESVLGSKPEP
nr:protein MET1, chloroplastic [Tanacetum cinerariifolium]